MLPNTVNVVVWYELVPKTGGKGYELKKHDFGSAAAGHGVGSGDINGDGRTDLLTPKGWFEAPAAPAAIPGRGAPNGIWARQESRSWLVTSMATDLRTSCMEWDTTMVSSGPVSPKGQTANERGPKNRSTSRWLQFMP